MYSVTRTQSRYGRRPIPRRHRHSRPVGALLAFAAGVVLVVTASSASAQTGHSPKSGPNPPCHTLEVVGRSGAGGVLGAISLSRADGTELPEDSQGPAYPGAFSGAFTVDVGHSRILSFKNGGWEMLRGSIYDYIVVMQYFDDVDHVVWRLTLHGRMVKPLPDFVPNIAHVPADFSGYFALTKGGVFTPVYSGYYTGKCYE